MESKESTSIVDDLVYVISACPLNKTCYFGEAWGCDWEIVGEVLGIPEDIFGSFLEYQGSAV